MFMKRYDYNMYKNDKIMKSLGNNMTRICIWNDMIIKEFEVTDLELLKYYLGIEVYQMKDCIMLRQLIYTKKAL